ncbi:MAG: ABC transporter ATP-binding protein [Lactobacillales bacterium]|jgi:ABC-type multidrug transport system ATPase subunit|nr:ABC transporter ATP-binding protein [Lactobacillales bacterium]
MVLEVKNVTKKFRKKLAVDNVSLKIPTGIIGLLGANGAGKTTLMKMIADILKPTSGEILYDGKNIHLMGEAYRDLFGFLPQEFGFDHNFTVKNYLEYIAALKDVPAKETVGKIDHLLKLVSLSDVKNKKIIKLSGGMKRRVGIVQTLLNDPKILVMDEPTAGLDPGERIRFRNLIFEFSHNRSVIISTHIVSDIENVAKQIFLMKAGKIIDSGSVNELVKKVEGKIWSSVIPANQFPTYAEQLQIIYQREEGNNQMVIRYLSDKAQLNGAVSVSPSLEDLYFWLFPQDSKWSMKENVF